MAEQKRAMAEAVMVIPYPAQSHINSLLHISYKLLSKGFNVLFVNTDYNHRRISETAAVSGQDQINGGGGGGGEITFVSLPDGLDPEEDRNVLGRLMESLFTVFPLKLEELLIRSSNEGSRIIRCIIADVGMAPTLEVAQKLGIRGVFHWPMAASYLALLLRLPQLEQDGIIDSNGFPLKHEKIQLYSGMPTMDSMELPWYTCGLSAEERKLIFEVCKKDIECLNLSDWWLCNSIFELEKESFALLPKLYPVGPFIDTSSLGGQFWSEDISCLSWLDEQSPKSTVFIAFGSFTIFNLEQFQELASAINALKKPVLWVVRSDFTGNGSNNIEVITDRFQGNDNVKIVRWAPQLKVLSHPAIACFVSHCGWNSTMEGVANGVPFLCWPYFADQVVGKAYICELWKNGLSLEKNADGIVTKDEFTSKVERLLDDEGIQERAQRLKEFAIESSGENGNSSRNFDHFIEWLETPN